MSRPHGVVVRLLALPLTTSMAWAGSVRHVDDNAPPGGDGLSWQTAYRYLQDALLEAGGDRSITAIRVGQGTYKPDQDEGGAVVPGDRAAFFALLDGVSLLGGFAGFGMPDPDVRDPTLFVTILSGDLAGDDGPDFENNDENSHNVLKSPGFESEGRRGAAIDGFTIQGGHGQPGAGVRNDDGVVWISRCRFIANFGSSGAGIYNSGTLAVDRCDFAGNCGASGGAIFNGGEATVVSCNVIDNESTAVVNYFTSSAVYVGCLFVGNYGRFGGGMLNIDSSPQIVNCTFYGNTWGHAPGGGALLNAAGASTPLVSNCVIVGNEPPQIGQEYPKDLAIVRHSIVEGGFEGVMVLDVDPLFIDAVGGDFRVTGTSRTIDAGENATVPVGVMVDLDGNPRFLDDPCIADPGMGRPPVVDIGAYEYQVNGFVDCDRNGLHDPCEFFDDPALDCDGDLIADSCEIAADPGLDCNANGVLDQCEIDDGRSPDCNANGLPDDCEDCNGNGVADECDIADGTSRDEDVNGQPDECEAILFVDDDTCPGPGDGTEADPYCSIQAAIDAAEFGDDVIVAPGIYPETLDFLGKTIVVRSAGGAAVTVIDGQRAGTVLRFEAGEGPATVLTGFTITGGSSSSPGGGAVIAGASPVFRDCRFQDNAALHGGGAAVMDTGEPAFIRCAFEGNVALGEGGGLYVHSAGPRVVNCVLLENSAGTHGGGARLVRDEYSTWVNCLMSGNIGAIGAGMAASGGGFTILVNGTIVGNAAAGGGGGLVTFNEPSNPGPAVFLVHNSILWINTPTQFTDLVGISSLQFCTVQGGYPGPGNSALNPLFVGPRAGDFRLGPGSPCIDSGDNSALPFKNVDLDGGPRLQDDPDVPDSGSSPLFKPVVDRGAYERQP